MLLVHSLGQLDALPLVSSDQVHHTMHVMPVTWPRLLYRTKPWLHIWQALQQQVGIAGASHLTCTGKEAQSNGSATWYCKQVDEHAVAHSNY